MFISPLCKYCPGLGRKGQVFKTPIIIFFFFCAPSVLDLTSRRQTAPSSFARQQESRPAFSRADGISDLIEVQSLFFGLFRDKSASPAFHVVWELREGEVWVQECLCAGRLIRSHTKPELPPWPLRIARELVPSLGCSKVREALSSSEKNGSNNQPAAIACSGIRVLR